MGLGLAVALSGACRCGGEQPDHGADEVNVTYVRKYRIPMLHRVKAGTDVARTLVA
jgi:hypothetical protein